MRAAHRGEHRQAARVSAEAIIRLVELIVQPNCSCAILNGRGQVSQEEFMGKLVLGVATLALSAGAASAQVYVSPGYGYGYGYGAPLYDYAAPGYGYAAAAPLYDYAAPAYGYAATAPLYNYAAPAYAAPATAGTTVIIVNPAPAYTAPVVSRPLYSYAPGYWGGYGWGGYGRYRAGYWWR
jgi:hypothetical protein